MRDIGFAAGAQRISRWGLTFIASLVFTLCALVSPAQALADDVSSFEEFKSAVTQVSSGGECSIVVTAPFTINERVEVQGDVVISGDADALTAVSFSGDGVIVVYGSLSMGNLVFSGENLNHVECEFVRVMDNATFTLSENAKLTENDNSAVHVEAGGTFIMNGGEISYNENLIAEGESQDTSTHGGAIYASDSGWNNGESASVVINGGTISHNKAQYGGAIGFQKSYTNSSSLLEINGGTFIDNEATKDDGDNIHTEVDVVVGENARVDGIYLKVDGGSTTTPQIVLNGIPETVGVERVSGDPIGFELVSVNEGSYFSMSSDLLSRFTYGGGNLLYLDDGRIFLGNVATNPDCLILVRSQSVLGSQSGSGWSWDKQSLTLTISESLSLGEGSINAIVLPDGSTLVIQEGVCVSLKGCSSVGLSGYGDLTIQGPGKLDVLSDGGTTAIQATGQLRIIDAEVAVGTNIEGYSGIYSNSLEIDGSSVTVYGVDGGSFTFGIQTYSSENDITISDGSVIEVTDATYGIFAGLPSNSTYGCTVSITDSVLNVGTLSGIRTQGTNSAKLIIERTSGFIGINEPSAGEQGGSAVTVPTYGAQVDVASDVVQIDGLSNGIKPAFFSDDTSADPWPYVYLASEDGSELYYVELMDTSKVTGVSLSKDSLSLTSGSSAQLEAGIVPDTATNKNVKWSTSDPAVVTVDDAGVVTAVAPGTATITVTTEEGDFTATCEVTVSRPYVPPADPTYPPETGETENGEVTVTPSRPHEGDEVVIEPRPDEGFEVGGVTVTDKDGNSVEVTDNGDGTWSFEQPKGAVTITVTFACDGGELCPTHPFGDVDPDAWYHDAVDWAVTGGVLNGYGDGDELLGPLNTITRAEMAQVLWNRAGRPEAEADLSGFADVDASGWYADPVAWCLEQGIFQGYGDAFGTERPISREEVATVLWRLSGSPEPSTGLSSFSDSESVSDYATDALAWAVEAGVVTGKDDGTKLDPQGVCTRAEAAAMLMRLSME